LKKVNILDTGKRTLFALAIIGLSAYFGFTPLFELIDGGIAAAVIGASFSVTFVIILTMYLLNKQTEIQQESKKGEKVFEEKVSIYKSILSHTREMLKDGKLSREEIIALSFSAIELQMVGADQTISAFNSVFDTANTIYHSDDNEEVIISEQQKMEIYKTLSLFSQKCRMDLGINEAVLNQEIFNATIEELNSAVRGKNDLSKYKFKNKEYGKGQLVLAVIKDYAKENKPTYDELVQKFSEIKSGPSNIILPVNEVKDKLENSKSSKKRYFMEQKDIITLSDQEIMVSNQWGVENIGNFIEHCKKYEIKIEKS